MLGFLFKILIVAGLVAGLGFYFTSNKVSRKFALPDLSHPSQLIAQVSSLDVGFLGSQISTALDALVTKQEKSPFVMGIEVTNNSLEAIVDSIYNLPSDQVQEIKDVICQPPASSASAEN